MNLRDFRIRLAYYAVLVLDFLPPPSFNKDCALSHYHRLLYLLITT